MTRPRYKPPDIIWGVNMDNPRDQASIPVFPDMCDYVDENGFEMFGYFIRGGVVKEPEVYRGRMITDYELTDDGKMVLVMSSGDRVALALQENDEFIIEKHGVVIRLHLARIENILAPAIEPIDPETIDYDKLMETALRQCTTVYH